MPPSPLASFEGVSKAYQYTQALDDVSFALQPGEVFGYIGPNGAGKTTSLKILAGLLSRFEGKVRVAGKSQPAERDSIHHEIGFLPQAPGFQTWRTVGDTLRSLGLLSGIPRAEIDGRVEHWLERFDLRRARKQRIKKLSGGMLQKLGLIQALLHEPRLLILDEPLAGLDPASRELVKDVVRERRAAGASVIFSSHILADVGDVADRVGILSKGRLLRAESIPELAARVPKRLEVEFSLAPRDIGFLSSDPVVSTALQEADGRWILELNAGVDIDDIVQRTVERCIAAGGRLRRIGALQPDLDELYRRVLVEADHA